MRRVLILLGVSVATVFATGFGSNYYDYKEIENYQEGHYDDIQTAPTFTAGPQDFTVEVDDDITFPCDVENLGSQTLMFQHIMPDEVHRMLFVGNLLLKPRGYKFKKNGNSFVLSGVTRRHAGKYECRIETNTVIQLVHTLNVQYPATVKRISPSQQSVPKGASVTLECQGDGNPKAAISWSKQQGHLPSGAKAEEGLSLTLDDVDRHVEGTYICTASNGVGPPSSTTMSIEVEYPPEIVSDQAMLHTGEGDNAKLLCIVHGRPSPMVSWKKDGELLATENYQQEHDGLHRHTLTITNVQAGDFGEYTCMAENTRGLTEHTLRLTGLPKPPRVTSSPAGGERDAYTITWETESDSPITQYRLRYRKAKVNISSNPLLGWDDRLYFPPTVNNEENQSTMFMNPIRYMSHGLTDLEPASDYEATISIENKFGWSNTSDIFRFNTRKEVAVGQSASGSDRKVIHFVLLMMVLGAFVY